jgi:hypothetical protein
VDKLKRDIEEIKEAQIEMKIDLREHMRRTDILEQLHRDNQGRIEGLEAPKKAREYFVSVVVDISKFTGFILAILAILKYAKVI